ncbi:MAG: hypothetical protein AAF498_04670 [Pseudomonadota bacterium]
MQETRHTIRNLDPDLMIEAKIHVLQTGRRTLGDLINEAIAALIDRETQDEEEPA